MRSQAHLAVGAEDRPGEREQRALEVSERETLVDREPSICVNIGGVGGVGGVAPVAAPAVAT